MSIVPYILQVIFRRNARVWKMYIFSETKAVKVTSYKALSIMPRIFPLSLERKVSEKGFPYKGELKYL